MSRVAKVTISLPQDLLAFVESQRPGLGETRSEVIRYFLEHARRAERERADVERYIRGYEEQPQTEEEFGWSTQVALKALADLPWEPAQPAQPSEANEASDETRGGVVGEPAAAVAQKAGAAHLPR
jgi:hypothetical protein